MSLDRFGNQRTFNTNVSNNYYLIKKGTTSGGSRFSFYFKNKIPLNIKFKQLTFNISNKSGRNSTGRIVM